MGTDIKMNAKNYYDTKSVVIFFICILAGIIILFVSSPTNWQLFGQTVGATILISGLAGISSEFFLRRSFLEVLEESNEKIENLFTKREKIRSIGLQDIYVESHDYGYDDFIRKNKKIVISINDGRGWINDNIEELRIRFQDQTKETIFVILKDDAPILDIQALKTQTNVQALKQKYMDVVKQIKELNKNNNIELYAHNYYNPQTIFLGDNEVIITPYYTSPWRGAVPLMVYEDRKDDHCYFAKVQKDMHRLLEKSVKIV